MQVFSSEVADYRGLTRRFAERADAFAAAQPFPHAIFHDLFDLDVLRQCADEFAPFAEMSGQHDGHHELKSSEARWDRFGPATRAVVAELQSAAFIGALEMLARVPGLISDPELWGGGQHQIRRGGHLGVHADFNRHPNYPMNRRLNALLYLNEDWDPAWGGSLDLWDTAMEHVVESIVPAMNTLVVFETTSESFHGHPDPLECPDDRSRRSLAFYYYVIGDEEATAHSTLFKQRPGDRFKEPSRASQSVEHVKKAVYLWVPDSIKRRRQAK